MLTGAEFDAAIEAAGGAKRLAERLDESIQTIINWRSRGVPAQKAKAFERATGISVKRLREDWADYWPDGENTQPSALDEARAD